MTRPLVFTIPGDPHAQGRARMRVVTTKTGQSFASAYDPKESRDWKATVGQIMGDAKADWKKAAGLPDDHHLYPFPLEALLELVVFVMFPCPKGDHRKIPVLRRWCGKAKDADNLAKAIMDAGNGVIYPDDRSIAHLDAYKIIAAQGEPPRTVVSVRVLDQGDLDLALRHMDVFLGATATATNEKAEG